MATTDNAAKYDIAYINEFYDYLPKEITREVSRKGMYNLAKMGMIQRDRMAEKAMANASNGKYQCISEDGKDFTDGTDMKTATVNYRNNSKGKVIITGIDTKVGPLRVMAYDYARETFRYYFIFDYDKVKSYDRIEFGIFSNSKYNNGDCGFELDSFEELANIESDYF